MRSAARAEAGGSLASRLSLLRSDASLRLVVLVAGGLLITYLGIVNRTVIGIFHDDAVYTVLAKSLSEGSGYRLHSLPSSPAQLKYPFLYPSLLSSLWRMMPSFPDNVMLLKALNGVGFFAGLLLSYTFFRLHAEAVPVDTLMYALLIGANPLIFSTATLTVSETLFLTLTMGALSLERTATPARIGGLTLVVAAAYLTRTLGVALILAFVICFLLRRRYRHLLIFVVVTAAVLSPWWLWQFSHRSDPIESTLLRYYVGYKHDTHAALGLWSDWRRSVDVVWGNLRYVAESLDVALPLGGVPGLRPIVLLLLAIGTYQSLRQGLAVYHVFSAVYLLIIVGWPWHPLRFMAPLIPVVLLVLFQGVQTVDAFVRRTRQGRSWGGAGWLPRLPIVVMVLVTALWMALYARNDPRFEVGPAYERHYAHWPGFIETFAWVRQHTAPSDVLGTGHDQMYYLYTGRRAVKPWLYKPWTYFYPYGRHFPDLGDVDEIRRELARLGVRYLIIDPLDGYAEGEAAPSLFDHLLECYPVKPELVFTSSDGRHWIYRLP